MNIRYFYNRCKLNVLILVYLIPTLWSFNFIYCSSNVKNILCTQNEQNSTYSIIGYRLDVASLLFLEEDENICKYKSPNAVKITDHIIIAVTNHILDIMIFLERIKEFAYKNINKQSKKCKVLDLIMYISTYIKNYNSDENPYKVPKIQSILIIGYDDQPRLFYIDELGSYCERRFKAIGKNSNLAEDLILKKENEIFNIEKYPFVFLETFESVIGKKINAKNTEIIVLFSHGFESWCEYYMSKK